MLSLKEYDFLQSSRNDYSFDFETYSSSKAWRLAKDLYTRKADGLRSANHIPKKIHQIWLGGRLPSAYRRWQSTWKKHHPDWEYYLWTDKEIKDLKLELQDIFDQSKNFGVKSDILRYEILNQFGGLYVDTDFECLKSFAPLHTGLDFYAGLMNGKEAHLCNALIGSIPGHPILKEMISSIKDPVLTDDAMEIINYTGPGAFTEAFFKRCQENGLVNVAFPITFFYPFPNNMLHVVADKKIKQYVKKESFAIHHWQVSWQNTSALKRFSAKLFRYIPQRYKNSIKRTIKGWFSSRPTTAPGW